MLKGIIALLIADSTIQSLIGKDKLTQDYKVYPVACPQPQDDPYLVLSIVEGSIFTRCKDTTGDLDDTPFRVFCYAKTYPLAEGLGVAVRNVLDNHKGTVSGVKYQNVYFDDFHDGWDKDSGDGLFVRVLLFRALIDVSPGT